MRYVEKAIKGYATTYTKLNTPSSSSYPWNNAAKAFDWSPDVSPSEGADGATDWWSTYASVKVGTSTSSSYDWYADGIGGFKSCLDENFNDSYGNNGTTYTNFNCLPSDTEIKEIAIYTRASMPTYGKEYYTFFKNKTQVLCNSSGTATRMVVRSTTSSGASVSVTWGRYKKCADGKFYADGNISSLTIGTWTLNEIQSGLIKPRVGFYRVSGASGASYWYPRGFCLELVVDIPLYEITTSVSDIQGGVVSGGGEYFSGKTTTLTAIPNDGYTFLHWCKNGNIDTSSDGTSPTRTINIVEDAQYTAVFKKNKINNVLIENLQPSEIYVDTNKVKAIYIDQIKVYG